MPDKRVEVMIMKILIFIFCLNTWNAFATFTEKGMLPMDTQWWECKQGGPSIQCKTEECDAKCSQLLESEKEEKAAERTETLQDVLDDALKGAEQDKNPALFQLRNE